MNAVTVRRLKLSAPRDGLFAAQLAVERALALSDAGDGRLLLVRRITGHHSVRSTSPWGNRSGLAAQFDAQLAALDAAAVHGARADPDAPAVWFRDQFEALAIWIARRAHGQRPIGWFWSLALRGYWAHGDGLTAVRMACSPRRLLAGGADAAAWVRVLMAAMDEVEPEAVLLLLADGAEFSEVSVPFATVSAQWKSGDGAESTPVASPGHLSAGQAAPIRPEAENLARSLLLTPLGRIMAASHKITEHRSALQLGWLLLLLRAHPHLLAKPEQARSLWADIAELPMDGLVMPERPAAAPIGQVPAPAGTQAAVEAERSAAPSAQVAVREHGEVALEQALPEPVIGQIEALHMFQGGGLLLVLPALVRLGFPEWIRQACPDHQGAAAHGLLFALFARYRPTGLPLLALALGHRALPSGPPEHAEWTRNRLWLRLLDRWLRRRAWTRLHDLGQIAAWLDHGPERSVVRFGLQDIRMGLRRQALDRDPGWVPWLGISLRYDFSTTPAGRPAFMGVGQ